jgi:hypothetical protein
MGIQFIQYRVCVLVKRDERKGMIEGTDEYLAQTCGKDDDFE